MPQHFQQRLQPLEQHRAAAQIGERRDIGRVDLDLSVARHPAHAQQRQRDMMGGKIPHPRQPDMQLAEADLLSPLPRHRIFQRQDAVMVAAVARFLRARVARGIILARRTGRHAATRGGERDHLPLVAGLQRQGCGQRCLVRQVERQAIGKAAAHRSQRYIAVFERGTIQLQRLHAAATLPGAGQPRVDLVQQIRFELLEMLGQQQHALMPQDRHGGMRLHRVRWSARGSGAASGQRQLVWAASGPGGGGVGDAAGVAPSSRGSRFSVPPRA